MRFIYPEKSGEPMVIHLNKDDNPYIAIHQFLHNLYWIQNNDNDGYCYSDMVVLWDVMYDWAIERGKKPRPCIDLFRATSEDDKEFGWFLNNDDWCEGQTWIFIYACYMFDDLVWQEDGSFKTTPLDFLKGKGHESDNF